ncbi:hypothetical protein ACTFIZ_008282 [Dictyostelium cf. discoideum]
MNPYGHHPFQPQPPGMMMKPPYGGFPPGGPPPFGPFPPGLVQPPYGGQFPPHHGPFPPQNVMPPNFNGGMVGVIPPHLQHHNNGYPIHPTPPMGRGIPMHPHNQQPPPQQPQPIQPPQPHYPMVPGSFINQKPIVFNNNNNNNKNNNSPLHHQNENINSPPTPLNQNKINNIASTINTTTITTNTTTSAFIPATSTPTSTPNTTNTTNTTNNFNNNNNNNNNNTSTTAYIGKIPQFVEDSFIRSLLNQCGKVTKWNRASDTNGKLKQFGLCEFEHAEGAVTALRVLNDLEVDRDGGKLVVKVDKGQKFFSDYLDKKGGLTDQSSDSPQDIILRESIKAMVEKNFINIYEKKKMESNEINDFYNKDRRDLTKEEKIKIIEKEKEKEKQRHKERELKNKERDLKDFKEREKNWERRERTKEIDREKEKEKEKEKEQREIKARQLEMGDYSDSDEKMRKRIRSREAIKYRQKEREDDEKDRQRELAELAELELKRQKEEELNRIQLSSNINNNKKLKLVGKGFNSIDEDDENQSENELQNSLQMSKKKQTFIPLDYNEIDQVLNPQQYQLQKQQSTEITTPNNNNNNNNNSNGGIDLSRISNDREQIFKFKIDWNYVDKNPSIINESMKAWITTKVIEFFGAKEDELIDFILNLLKTHLEPTNIILKLRDVFENNADDFVLQLWRILLYYISNTIANNTTIISSQ